MKERNKRIKPSIDTKIITSWNSILLKGYVDAYSATGDVKYLDKAKNLANFIERELTSASGSLYRSFANGNANIPGFLDDYAWTAAAFIRLYEVSFDPHWMMLAKKITDYAIVNFSDKKSALLYFPQTKTLDNVEKKIEVADDYIPSSNAVMAKVLCSLGVVFDDTIYSNRSLKMLSSVMPKALKIPTFHIQWGIFAGLFSGKSYEIVMVGKNASLIKKDVLQRYLPTSEM